MKKGDLILIVMILLISLLSLFLFNKDKMVASKAIVYHDNEEILKIDLNINKKYEVFGDLGKVIIKVNNKKIEVIEETSKNNICSKQKKTNNVYESIICLPNKIVIELIGESKLDGVVK
ncbi:MAG: NusG domain II-containing protein [Bacilli bacterium]